MQTQPEKSKRVTDHLLEKSKALREKSKATETRLDELKAQVDKFMQSEMKENNKETT